MDSQQTIGFGLTTLGELLIGFSILQVHWRLKRERRVDRKVIKTIYTEELLTGAGMLFIILGFVLELPISVWTFIR